MGRPIRTLLAAALLAGAALPAAAQEVGVAISKFDDNFLTVLRNGMRTTRRRDGVTLQVEDAQNDVGKQLSQIQNFIATGEVDAIIVNPVDTDATAAMTSSPPQTPASRWSTSTASR